MAHLTIHETVCALVADPNSAHRFSCTILERALAVLRTSYGGDKTTGAHIAALRRAEDTASAVLRIKRAGDQAARERFLAALVGPVPPAAPVPPAPPAPPANGGGWKVKPRPRPTPGAPPAPALDLL